MTLDWKLEHSYTRLSEQFYSKVHPSPVATPHLILFNTALANTLGLTSATSPQNLPTETEYAQIFSGNTIPPGANPIAQAYAGHQYGHFTMLGDGRAILLGEQIDPEHQRWDIQLKGSGQTPYSRRGDGRAALGPMLREYLISEAMFALKISTTRSLAVTATGEPVYRERTLPGAVLTRVAASHIRVGTFEYASTRGPEAVRELADYVIQRHYPHLINADRPYEHFFREVVSRQACLIAAWLNVGFIHGVMNTDNMTISGETIDYGPCAFMDAYNAKTVFSSIDSRGRYSYGNQPAMGHWNLTRLAESLLSLFNPNQETAIELATEMLGKFGEEFSKHWKKGMHSKLGLFEERSDDQALIEDLLTWMTESKLDYTNTFRALTRGESPGQSAYKDWFNRWEQRRDSEGRSKEDSQKLIKDSNPNLIPRNHLVEAALSSAEDGNLEPFRKFVAALQAPFEDRPEHKPYLNPDPTGGRDYRTFCGT